MNNVTDLTDMDFLDTNHWVPIHTLPGFQGCIEYYISRDGEVLSTKGEKERILKTSLTDSGYPIVHLRKRLGKRGEICCTVHKLVAYAFLPPPPTPHGRAKGCTLINHIDHDRTNCRADNLEWISGSDNSKNCIDFLSTPFGQSEEHQRKRLSNAEYMRRKREDPAFREQECEAAKERYDKVKAEEPEAYQEMLDKGTAWKKANPEMYAAQQRRCAAKRSADPVRAAKHQEYKRRHREGVKADPEKAKKQREYQREYMKKRRARIKAEKKAKEDNTIQ